MRVKRNKRTKRLQELLLRRRNELAEQILRLREIGSVSRLPATDEAEVGVSSMEDETRATLLEGETDELRKVDDALARLKEGSYGRCEECGRVIPLLRLRIIPSTDLCVRCKSEVEGPKGPGGLEEEAWEVAEDFYKETIEEEPLPSLQELEEEAA